MKNTLSNADFDLVGLGLRIGLGLVFVIGGLSKLSLLLNDATHAGMVANYMGTTGYINALFQQFLFTGWLGSWLTPAMFLTTLSAFELVSGLLLLAGCFVKPLSLFYAFLLWSFVFSLPTMTVPGVSIEEATYTSPALFVQVRDIGLSGFMFVLFFVGAGRFSVDQYVHADSREISWDGLGLLLRLSMGVVLLVGGFFGDFAKIPTFGATTWILIPTGLLLLFGSPRLVQVAGAVTALIMLHYMVQKWSLDASLIKNLNGIKREFAFLFTGLVLLRFGGGHAYTLVDMGRKCRDYLARYLAMKTRVST